MAFEFEYRIKVRQYGQIRRHVEMKFAKGGVEIHADDIEMESYRFMARKNFAAFNEALGAKPDADPIETARAAVAAHKPGKVEKAISDHSVITSSFVDWDSPFYGR